MSFHARLRLATEPDRQRLGAAPIIRDTLCGRIRLPQYLAFLTEAYHHVRHTVPLLMACGAQLPPRLAWLQGAMAHYVEEEIGHDEWILSDIAACGADAEAVRAGKPRLETEVMVAYAYHQVERGNPVALLGMVHVLEGTSTALASNAAAAIREALRLPDGALTYLTTHGLLDAKHVEFFEGLVNRLEDPRDRDDVIASARAFYRLYGDIFRALPPFDASAAPEAG